MGELESLTAERSGLAAHADRDPRRSQHRPPVQLPARARRHHLLARRRRRPRSSSRPRPGRSRPACPTMLDVVEHQFYHCLAAAAVCRQAPGAARRARAGDRGEPARARALGGDVPGELRADVPAGRGRARRAGRRSRGHAGALRSRHRVGGAPRQAPARGAGQRAPWPVLARARQARDRAASTWSARATCTPRSARSARSRMLERKHPGAGARDAQLRLDRHGHQQHGVRGARRHRDRQGDPRDLRRARARQAARAACSRSSSRTPAPRAARWCSTTARGLTVAASRTAGAQQISTTSVAAGRRGAAALARPLRPAHRAPWSCSTTPPRIRGSATTTTSGPANRARCCACRSSTRTALIGVLYLENTLVSGAFTQVATRRADHPGLADRGVARERDAVRRPARPGRGDLARQRRAAQRDRGARAGRARARAATAIQLEDLIAERTQELTLANQKLRDAAAERERIEAELRLAQKLESVGRLAAGIAHEINTPVQYVSDSVTFLRDALPSLIDTIARYRALAAAVDAARRSRGRGGRRARRRGRGRRRLRARPTRPPRSTPRSTGSAGSPRSCAR